MKILHQVDYSYSVELDEGTGVHFIDIYCGGIASYSVRFELTAEEVEAFRDDPSALDGLARETQSLGRCPR